MHKKVRARFPSPHPAKHRFRTGLSLLILMLGFGRITTSSAEVIRLSTSGAIVNNNLGNSVGLSGNYAIVGVPHEDSDTGNNTGSARIFVRSDEEWIQQQKLLPTDTNAGDMFGASVAMSRDYAIIGAPGKNLRAPIDPAAKDEDAGEKAGAAYVFVRSGAGWTQQAKLLPTDLDPADFFGISVSIDGDTAIVGAHRHNWPKADGGAMYVFVRNGTSWTQQAKIIPDDTQRFDYFGYSVSLSGNSAIVGCIRNGHLGKDSGAAYIFVRNGTAWTQEAKLVGNNTGREDRFGVSVGISGNLAIVGCPNNGPTGAAYIFEREFSLPAVGLNPPVVGDERIQEVGKTKWVQQTGRFQRRIIPNRRVDGFAFGTSVAINDKVAIIGATHADGTGKVYTFTPNTKKLWEQQTKFAGNDSTASDNFGTAVAMSGNRLIAGAPNHSAGGSGSGAAYIFELAEATWQQQSKLSDSETASEDQFGYAVAIGDNFAIVGSRQDDDGGPNAGAAYLFSRQRINWTRQAKLIANDVAPGDLFGYAVAISGDTALIGAFGRDDAAPDAGAAYIFVRSGINWIQQAKLIGSDTQKFDHFGASVAIDGDIALIGAFGKDNGPPDSGAAYLFVRNGTSWTEQAKLQLNNPVAGDLFGFSVAISGNTALVGAYRRDEAGEDSGAAYVFARNGGSWPQQASLISNDVGIGDEFGFSVSISQDTAVIGAPKDDHEVADAGAAYIFARRGTNWIEQTKLSASNADANDQFGAAVSIDKDWLIVGASKAEDDSDMEANNGSAYTFLRSGLSWTAKRQIGDGSQKLDLFGSSIGIKGLFAIVGAHGNDDSGQDSGSAYVFNGVDLGFLHENYFLSVDPASLKQTTLGQIKQTALFQNYPNPFNPETWIPYTLAKEGQVTICIYNVRGRLVRELDLGIQENGIYFSKENAAYWNGKDQLGHTVASGIYFYTLTAGDVQATRRMIILK